MRRRKWSRRNPSEPTKAQLEKAVRELADHYLWQLIHVNAIDPDEGHRFLPRGTLGLAGVGEAYLWSDDGETVWNESIPFFTDGGAHAVDEKGTWIGWDLRFLK